MDIGYLKKCMSEIKVINLVNEDVDVINNSPLKMIGKGRQGAVFQFTENICVKVFGNAEDCDREHFALSLGQHTDLFPKIYAKGSLYIAMDIINGIDLREFLQSQPLTEELSTKLINLLITFKEIGFERIDHHKRQIFIQPDGNLKVIDVARTVWRDRVYPYPRKLLNSLGEENKQIFLAHVYELSPELYEEWDYYIETEKLASQICQLLLMRKSDKSITKKQIPTLLTIQNDKVDENKLTDLIHKVFKEEWVKTMLAHGKDPDEVMQKIDEHWEKLERIASQNMNGKNYDSTRPYYTEKKSNNKYYEENRNKNNNNLNNGFIGYRHNSKNKYRGFNGI